jgi:8-oxo-dGTP pyrophosphatase MutT (NUDIX family)
VAAVTDEKRMRRWAAEAAAGEGVVSEMVPAATVIVARDSDDGIEALMLRRNSKLAFAGGMWVFPGGRLDPDDFDLADTDAADADAAETDELAAYRRAAVREAREEADLVLDADTLVPFSHWEPPPITPKRFSTWFFLAPAPPGTDGEVAIDQGEIHDHAWMLARDALARRDLHEVELAPPTWVTLYELSRWATVAEALTAAAARIPEHFTTKVAVRDKDVIALWHGDAGYGMSPDDPADADVDGPRHRLFMVETGWRYERS